MPKKYSHTKLHQHTTIDERAVCLIEYNALTLGRLLSKFEH